jgi:hypothetical protein
MDSFPGPLGQVTINLIMNAAIHAFVGRTHGMISVLGRQIDEQTVELVFSDDGIGIPADILHRIFEPFFTTRMGLGGSGLGLTIVHQMVTQVLRGRVSVESKPGEGAALLCCWRKVFHTLAALQCRRLDQACLHECNVSMDDVTFMGIALEQAQAAWLAVKSQLVPWWCEMAKSSAGDEMHRLVIMTQARMLKFWLCARRGKPVPTTDWKIANCLSPWSLVPCAVVPFCMPGSNAWCSVHPTPKQAPQDLCWICFQIKS